MSSDVLDKIEKDTKNNFYGAILILSSGVCFAFLGIFGKFFFQKGFDVGLILTARFITASIFLALVFLIRIIFKKVNYFHIDRKHFFAAIFLGVFGYACFSTLLFMSFKYLSVSLAVMLLFTFPFFVFFGSVFLGQEKFTIKKVISLSMVAIGLFFLLSVELKVESYQGVFFAVLSAALYGLYILISARYQKNINPVTSSFYVITGAAVALLLYNRPDFEKIWSADFNIQINFLLLGLIGTVLPLSLFQAGLQKISGTKASVLGTVEPVLASFYAFLLFGEPLNYLQMLGVVIIVIADILILK